MSNVLEAYSGLNSGCYIVEMSIVLSPLNKFMFLNFLPNTPPMPKLFTEPN